MATGRNVGDGSEPWVVTPPTITARGSATLIVVVGMRVFGGAWMSHHHQEECDG
jgi:hypothetical protein